MGSLWGLPELALSSMTPLFTARDIRCAIPAPGGGEHVVFDGVSFALDAGEIVDVTGPSGSGKSSLLTAFARLNPYASETLTLDGRDAASLTPQQWRRLVAYVPQRPSLIGTTVAQAVRLPWTLAVRRDAPDAGAPPSDGAVHAMLDAMGCADVELERAPHDLSGGQAARVSLARALLSGPLVLLADEVDAGLDDDNARLVADLLARTVRDAGLAVVRIRHRAPDGRASRILRLDRGQLTDISRIDAPQHEEEAR